MFVLNIDIIVIVLPMHYTTAGIRYVSSFKHKIDIKMINILFRVCESFCFTHRPRLVSDERFMLVVTY